MNEKIKNAVRILQLAEKQADVFGEPVEIAYSGGKDSDVLLELARMAGIKYRAIYKNTTIDPPGTIAHCRANGVEIRQPKKTFFQIVKSSGFPSFRFRFCCQRLKEYKILNVAAWGVRADESPARAKRYTTFNFCRKYSERERVQVYAPIFDWTIDDIKKFIEARNIQLAPHYYREDGTVDYTRRLGCMGCPLQYNRGVEDFKGNLPLLRATLRAINVWCASHPRQMFANCYELFVYRIFYKSTEKYLDDFKRASLFENKSAKQYLEDFFNTNLTL